MCLPPDFCHQPDTANPLYHSYNFCLKMACSEESLQVPLNVQHVCYIPSPYLTFSHYSIQFLSNGSTYPFSTPSLVPMSVVESDLASWNVRFLFAPHRDRSYQSQVHLNLECLHEVVGSQAAKATDMGGSGILKAKDAESSEISKYKGVKGGRISKAKVCIHFSLPRLSPNSVLEAARRFYKVFCQGVSAFHQDEISPGHRPFHLKPITVLFRRFPVPLLRSSCACLSVAPISSSYRPLRTPPAFAERNDLFHPLLFCHRRIVMLWIVVPLKDSPNIH